MLNNSGVNNQWNYFAEFAKISFWIFKSVSSLLWMLGFVLRFFSAYFSIRTFGEDLANYSCRTTQSDFRWLRLTSTAVATHAVENARNQLISVVVVDEKGATKIETKIDPYEAENFQLKLTVRYWNFDNVQFQELIKVTNVRNRSNQSSKA